MAAQQTQAQAQAHQQSISDFSTTTLSASAKSSTPFSQGTQLAMATSGDHSNAQAQPTNPSFAAFGLTPTMAGAPSVSSVSVAQQGLSGISGFTGAMNAPGMTLAQNSTPGVNAGNVSVNVNALTAAAAVNQGNVPGFSVSAAQQAANAAVATNHPGQFLDDQQRIMFLDQTNQRNQMLLQRQTEYTNQLAATAAASRNAAFMNPNLLLTGAPQANTASRLGLGMDPSLLGNTAAGLSAAAAAPAQGTITGPSAGMNPSDHLALFGAQAAAANAANAQAAAQAAQQAANVRAAAAQRSSQGSQAAALTGMLPTGATAATHPAMLAAAAQSFNHQAMRGLNVAQVAGLDASAAGNLDLTQNVGNAFNLLNPTDPSANIDVLGKDHDLNHNQLRMTNNIVANSNNNNKGGNGVNGAGQGNNREMPVRPLSAYNFFFRDERERILNEDKPDSEKANLSQPDPEQEDAEALEKKKKRLLEQHLLKDRSKRRPHRKTHGKIGFTSLSKLIGKRWRELSDDKKQYYRDVAAMDMDRYQRDVAEYNKGRLFQKVPK